MLVLSACCFYIKTDFIGKEAYFLLVQKLNTANYFKVEGRIKNCRDVNRKYKGIVFSG